MKTLDSEDLQILKKKFSKHEIVSMIEIHDIAKNDLKLSDITIDCCKLGLLRLKKCELQNCKIIHSVICDDSYLRHATFINVDFTGTTFRDTNLEKANFINCDLLYTKFENCLLNSECIVNGNLPEESNLKLALLYQLYRNEISNGNLDEGDKILYKVRDCENEFYKDLIYSKDKYYENIRSESKCHYVYLYSKR